MQASEKPAQKRNSNFERPFCDGWDTPLWHTTADEFMERAIRPKWNPSNRSGFSILRFPVPATWNMRVQVRSTL